MQELALVHHGGLTYGHVETSRRPRRTQGAVITAALMSDRSSNHKEDVMTTTPLALAVLKEGRTDVQSDAHERELTLSFNQNLPRPPSTMKRAGSCLNPQR